MARPLYMRLLASLLGLVLSGSVNHAPDTLVLIQVGAHSLNQSDVLSRNEFRTSLISTKRSTTKARIIPHSEDLRNFFRLDRNSQSEPKALSFREKHKKHAWHRTKVLDGSTLQIANVEPAKINSEVGGEVLVTLENEMEEGVVPRCDINSHPQGWEWNTYMTGVLKATKEGKNQVRCKLPAKDLDGLVQLRIGTGHYENNIADVEYVKPLIASFDMTPYFGSDRGFLLVRTDLNGAWEDRAEFRVRVTCKTCDKSTLYESKLMPKQRVYNKFLIQFDRLGINASFNSFVRVELLDERDMSLASVETRLVRVPGRKRGQVAIDHQRRSLRVDGRPFLPVSWFMALDHGSEQVINNLREMSRRGVNSVMIYNLVAAYSKTKFKVRGEPLPTVILDACVTLGIKVHAYVLDLANNLARDFDESSDDYMALGEAIRDLRDHPAILSWYVADDDSGEDLPLVYDYIKELDPYHPVSIAVAMPRQQSEQKYVTGADIIMTETYPSDGDAAYRIMQTSNHWPNIFMPSITCGRAWTLEEDGYVISQQVFRSQLYHALIGGATGEVWFRFHEAKGWNNPGVPLLEESGNIARELLEIVPSIINAGPWDDATWLPALKVSARHQNGTMATSPEAMRARAMREPSGMVTLLVANGRNEPMQAIVQLGDNTPGVYDANTHCTEATVPFELSSWTPRRVQVCNGLVQEWLPSWGVQMFRFNGTSRMAKDQLPSYPLTLETLMHMRRSNLLNAGKEKPMNVIVNPGFETSSTFVSAPDGWYCGMADYPKGNPDSTCFADTTIKRSGRHSGRFVSGANPYLFRIRPTTWLNSDSYMGTLHEGKYRGSVWAQSDHHMELMAVRLWAATGADTESPMEEVLSQVQLTSEGVQEWQELQFELDLKDDDEPTAGLAIGFKVNRPGVLWLDDMELFRVEDDEEN